MPTAAAMRLVPLLLAVSALAGCGSTEPGTTPGGITESQRNSSRNAVELVGRTPGLRVIGSGIGARLLITKTGTEPFIVINGSPSTIEELAGVAPEAVTDVEVFTAMSETMVYGQEAALSGVVRVTVRVGDDE